MAYSELMQDAILLFFINNPKVMINISALSKETSEFLTTGRKSYRNFSPRLK